MARPAGILFVALLALLFLLPAPCLAADKAAKPTADVPLDPDMDEGHRQFAHTNYEKALEHYLKALERNKEDAYLHFRIGLTYYMLGDMDNSRNYWNESINMNSHVGDMLVITILTDYMTPTLLNRDIVITDDKYYNYINPERNDVIYFYTLNDNEPATISRIIGLPGDLIKIENNLLYKNNTHVKKLATTKTKRILKPNKKQLVVPSGCYYVRPDNKSAFIKKKHTGCVKKDKIIGKVFAILGSKETTNGNSKPREERFGLVVK